MDNKKKLIILIVSIIALILLIIGGTYAFITWSSNENQTTNVTFTVTPDFSCSADAGGHITSNDIMLAPTDCMDPEYAIQRTITTSSTTSNDKVVSMDLWLNVNHVDTNLLNSSNFKYAITKNKNSCTLGVINSGVIGTDISNNKIDLLEGVEYATFNDTYYLYIWLDEAESNSNTMNQSFDLSIGGECTDNGLEKTTMVSLNSTSYFRETDYITKITEIHFVYDKDLPNGVIEKQVSGKQPYQLSTDANKPIYGYLNKIGDTDTYKLYITSPYKIYAGVLTNAFSGMSALTSITFDNFDTSGTTITQSMFNNCKGLTSLDLRNFNTSNVTSMYLMFTGCTGLTAIDLSSFNTSRVNNMQRVFYNCRGLTSLDLRSFDTSNVTNMASIFEDTVNLKVVYVSNLWNTDSVTNDSRMFWNSGVKSLTFVD